MDSCSNRTAQTHTKLTGAVSRVATDNGYVGNDTSSLWSIVFVRRVKLDTARVVRTHWCSTSSLVLDNQCILNIALITLIEIYIVIVIVSEQRMFNVDCAAKPFNAIVLVTMNLNIVNQGAVTNSLKGQTINFIVGSSDQAALSDTHVTDNTAVVSWYVATIFLNKVTAFTEDIAPAFAVSKTGACSALTILWGETLDYNTAPFAHTIVIFICKAAKGDWLCSCTYSFQLRATSHQQHTVSSAANIGTWLNS